MLLHAPLVLAAHEPAIPSEVVALRALYEATGGAAWGGKRSERWLTGDPCGVPPFYCGAKCQGWAGVTCWGPGGHVRTVQLKAGRGAKELLGGTLPSELGLLRGLSTLDLTGLGLSGTLPSELARVPFRRPTELSQEGPPTLRLAGQPISGTLPVALALALPDDIRCQLPDTLTCPSVGAPPACTFARSGARGASAAKASAAVNSCGVAPGGGPPEARSAGGGGGGGGGVGGARRRLCPATASMDADASKLASGGQVASLPVGRLCEAIGALGLGHALPAASTAEAVVKAGYRSVGGFAAAAPAAVAAALGRVARNRGTRAAVANRTAEALEAHRDLRRQAVLTRRWAVAVAAAAAAAAGRHRATPRTTRRARCRLSARSRRIARGTASTRQTRRTRRTRRTRWPSTSVLASAWAAAAAAAAVVVARARLVVVVASRRLRAGGGCRRHARPGRPQRRRRSRRTRRPSRWTRSSGWTRAAPLTRDARRAQRRHACSGARAFGATFRQRQRKKHPRPVIFLFRAK